jgi:hypothetical protein
MTRSGTLFVAAVLFGGCRPAQIVEPDCFGGDPSTQSDRAVLWDGYGYHWQDLSHRIAFLRAGTSAPDEDGNFVAQMGILGGDWADGRVYRDQPHFANGHSILQAGGAGLAVPDGEVERSVGADGRAAATVDLDLDEVGLPDRENYLVGLRGVCLDANVPLGDGYTGDYDPSKGWTPQAFGARVADPVVDGRGFTFTAALRFEAGALDRGLMNDAIPHQRLDGTVRYVVLALDAASVTRASVGANVFHSSRGEAHSYIPEIPPEALTVPFEAAPGGTVAFPLLTGWQFVLNRESDPEQRGRYLRSWTARIDAFDYAPEDGSASVTMDLYLSHASTFQEGDLEVEHTGEFDFVVLDDEDATLERGLVLEAMDTLGNFDHSVSEGDSE